MLTNNISVVSSIVIIGIVSLGLYSVILLFTNGYIFGSTVAALGAKHLSLFFFYVLPHGVFEISGLLLSGALALRAVELLISGFRGYQIDRQEVVMLVRTAFTIAVLTTIAGIIETTIAYTLI